MFRNIRLFLGIYDIRHECFIKYGRDFVDKYDDALRGIPFRSDEERRDFFKKLEELHVECKSKGFIFMIINLIFNK